MASQRWKNYSAPWLCLSWCMVRLSSYGSSTPELTSIQYCFLDRSQKRGYTSFPVCILNWLES